MTKKNNDKPETRWEMGRKILVPLLKSVVLLDVMQIVPSDDNCALHFHARNNACQNTATDAYIACEGAFLVDVGSLEGLLRDFMCSICCVCFQFFFFNLWPTDVVWWCEICCTVCLSFLIISFLVGFQLTAKCESCLLWFATHVTKKIKTTCTALILYLKDHHSHMYMNVSNLGTCILRKESWKKISHQAWTEFKPGAVLYQLSYQEN